MCGADQRNGRRNLAFAVRGCLEQLASGQAIERMARDVRMFTIGGGTTEVLRTLIASKALGRKLPQTRDGYVAG